MGLVNSSMTATKVVDVGDKVRLKPTKGCCDSTLFMYEWEVVELSEVVFSKMSCDMALIKYDNRLEIVETERLSLI